MIFDYEQTIDSLNSSNIKLTERIKKLNLQLMVSNEKLQTNCEQTLQEQSDIITKVDDLSQIYSSGIVSVMGHSNSFIADHEHSSNYCNHIPQCTLRQPFPPPLISLQSSESEEHLKFHKLKEGNDKLNRENLKGCTSCFWMEFYGEQYGYPDMDSSS